MKQWLFLGFYLCFGFLAIGQEALIKSRLENLHSKVPLPYNPIVDAQIQQYLQNKDYTLNLLSKSNYYLKPIEEILVKNKLPKELRILPAVVSGLDNKVVSDDGGSGFWQLRYHVAKSYDVHISSYVDERRDYLEASRAASLYLSELHHMYNNWLLAIAAYYADPIELNKAIRMAGGSLDYWNIHPNLPEKYQLIVPRFIALTYIFNYQKDLGLNPDVFHPAVTDTVTVTRFTSLQQIGRAIEMDADQISELNPIFKKKIVPFAGNPYLLQLPPDKAVKFRNMGDTVYTKGQVIPAVDTTTVTDTIQKSNAETSSTPKAEPKGEVMIYHTVKSGEFLGMVADLYDCNVSEVKKWNKLRSDRLNSGQKLKVYVPAARQSYYKKINSMSSSEKKRIVNQD